MLRDWLRLGLVAGISSPALILDLDPGVGLGVGVREAFAETPAAETQTPASETTGACVAPGPADIEAAKQAFRDGQIAFSEGDYSGAAELWSWAYDRDCTAHALLLNLAIAHELLGRPDQAAQALTLFDDRVPDSPYVAANQRRILRLQRTPTSAIRPRREAPKACPPSSPPRVDQGRATSVLPLAVALSGGAVALLGGAFYVQARAAASSASDGCGGQPGRCADVERVLDGERARARAETAGWLTSAGLVTLAGGLVWHFASPREPIADERGTNEPLRLTSSVSADRLGIPLSGGF